MDLKLDKIWRSWNITRLNMSKQDESDTTLSLKTYDKLLLTPTILKCLKRLGTFRGLNTV